MKNAFVETVKIINLELNKIFKLIDLLNERQDKLAEMLLANEARISINEKKLNELSKL